MTTTGADLDIKDVYTPQQITRLAALQGIAAFIHVLPEKAVNTGVLIELAEYVIGDDEPFDPVAEAHKAMAAIRFERGENYNGYDPVYVDGHDGCEYDDDAGAWSGPGAHEDGPLADWERELLAEPEPCHGIGYDGTCYDCADEEPVVGDITVSDLAGFLTLPTTAILLDEDGDTWHYGKEGWAFGGSYAERSPREMFEDFARWANGDFSFIVTNPEVLS